MSEFNLHQFLGEPNIPDNSYINGSIYRKAALKHDFNIEKDFLEFDQKDINHLKDHSVLKMDGNSQLNDFDQKAILNNLIESNNLEEVLSSFNLKDTVFSELLHKVLNNERIIPEELTNEQIYFYSRALKLVSNNYNDQINLKSYLEREHFFSKFKRPIKNFAGRKEHLKTLKNYVDWLPKSGFIPTLKQMYRNVTDRHQKSFLLILGIGGIGKTALISKFIDDHSITKKGQTLPFVYVDFDLIGFSIKEPLNFLIEGLKQLEFQFPKDSETLKFIGNEISASLNKDSNRGYNNRGSNLSSRRYLFDRLSEMHYENINKIKTPILIVFDSFEEMQYKAPHSELIEFFEFIELISNYIPRIRPIFIGRAEMDETVKEFNFKTLPLTEFDNESADAILKNNGVEDKKARSIIYNRLGGNPLVLNLAASLYKKSPDFINSKHLYKSAEVQEYLVGRILDHIHDNRVRKIAVPGLLVRKINPEVILEVLAIPCGLNESHVISMEEAKKIFEILKEESFLLQSSVKHDEIVFRQDLRIVCEKMIVAKHPEKSIMIHKAAIDYYKNKLKDVAEYNFHVLKLKEHSDFIDEDLGNSIDFFNQSSNIDYESAESLQGSFMEFSEESQFNIKNIYGAKASLEMLENSDSEKVAGYYTKQMEQVVVADLKQIVILEEEISQTSLLDFYCKQDDFLFMYATLKQRLGKLEESIELIAFKSEEIKGRGSKNNYKQLRFIFLLAENHLYSREYEVTFELLNHLKELIENEEKWNDNFAGLRDFLTLHLKTIFLLNLVKSRLDFDNSQFLVKNSLIKIVELYVKGDRIQLYFEDLAEDYPKLNVKWIYILSEIYRGNETINYLSLEQFENQIMKLNNNVKKSTQLERICKGELNVFLKDITLEGILEILIFDFVISREISNLNSIA